MVGYADIAPHGLNRSRLYARLFIPHDQHDEIRPFQLKKKNMAGGILKMNQGAVFWWGGRKFTRVGGRAEL